jgi:hypothetical protein
MPVSQETLACGFLRHANIRTFSDLQSSTIERGETPNLAGGFMLVEKRHSASSLRKNRPADLRPRKSAQLRSGKKLDSRRVPGNLNVFSTHSVQINTT